MNTAHGNEAAHHIAVVGMAGRFPGAPSVEAFWENLRDGVEGVKFFSDDELRTAGVDSKLLKNPAYVKAKAYLDEAGYFDAGFFGYNPREADIIDPQQRLFLETAWEALEDAGFSPDSWKGHVGVFGGVSMNSYIFNLIFNSETMASVTPYQIMIGNDKDYVATRVSYKLNLKGPSIGVQTACSTSLVAIERACRSLANHECDMALAGAATVNCPRKTGYLYQEGMILSPDGHCRVFDEKARGTVAGEGVGIVALKRLDEAVADRNRVYAVVRGWAANNDGSLKVGFTAPGVNGQAEVIAMAQALADVSPETIRYIEAHGTGTELGDPIEVAALTQVFRASTDKVGFCRIGSVKSNIGHLDSAAGVTGFIKAALCLYHEQIPPSLHFETPNSKIDFANNPFRVNTELYDWPRDDFPRRAGVSSFGIGGTNAHVVLEDAPAREPCGPERSMHLLLLSARTDSALEAATSNLAGHLDTHPETELADAAHTLQAGRHTFDYRRIAVCESREDAIGVLTRRDPKRLLSSHQSAVDASIAFLFPGQGSQHASMSLGLYKTEPTFHQIVDDCSEFLKPQLDVDLRDVLFPVQSNDANNGTGINETVMAQPALFVVEYALARLWMQWGIRPQAMVGHSIGEFTAACLAGVFGLEDMLTVIATRAKLMQAAPRGAMLAVPLSEADVTRRLNGRVSLAAINAPTMTVVSGPVEDVEALENELGSENVSVRRLQTSHAFHSSLMQPAADKFAECVGQFQLKPPNIPFVSNVTGNWIRDEDATDPRYWAGQLRHPVRFADSIHALLEQPDRVFLEVGPGQVLTTLARQSFGRRRGPLALASMRHPLDSSDDSQVLMSAVGRLWLAGLQVDWNGFDANSKRRLVSLPSYPFERQNYFVEPHQASAPTAAPQIHKKSDVAEWLYLPCWKQFTPPNVAGQDLQSAEQVTWLMFADELGLADQLSDRLRASGHRVIAVRPGAEFAKHADDDYTINPRIYKDYVSLFEDFADDSETPKNIVHVWGVTNEDDPHAATSDSFQKTQELGFYSLVYLAQVIERQRIFWPIQITVLSNHLQDISGTETISPDKATVQGPCLVIPQEYPHIYCRNVDVEYRADDNRALVTNLVDELLREPSEPLLAYRGRHRWVQYHEHFRIRAAAEISPHLKKNGTYLITGGLGRIGLVFAKYLSQRLKANLVLTARSEFPEKDQWDERLKTYDPDDFTCQRIRAVQELEQMGSEVLILSADSGSADEMASVVRQSRKRFGAINGVIHAAGIIETTTVHYLIQKDCERHFRAKALGLKVLDEVLEAESLDFVMLVSSLSAVLGGLGFCSYTAANSFMDAYAQRKNQQQDVPWFTIDWDSWSFADETEESEDFGVGATLAQLALTPMEGREVLGRVLSIESPQRIVISTGDLDNRIDQWVRREALASNDEQQAEETSATLHSRPSISSTYVEARNPTEQAIADVWQQLLGIAEIGIHDDFFELGGHSLLAAQVIARLQQRLEATLSIRSIFETTTVAGLATHIEALQMAVGADIHDADSLDEEHEEIEL